MGIIKKSEFKQMNDGQLKNKLEELKKEMMKLQGQVAMHTTLENPGRVKAVKKTIARIYTRLQEKKTVQSKEEPKKEASSQKLKKTKEEKKKKQ